MFWGFVFLENDTTVMDTVPIWTLKVVLITLLFLNFRIYSSLKFQELQGFNPPAIKFNVFQRKH